MVQTIVCAKCDVETPAVRVYENNIYMGAKCESCGEFSDMYGRYCYKVECECGEVVRVLTQKDDVPEYYTGVLVTCKCGKWVRFDLPVG